MLFSRRFLHKNFSRSVISKFKISFISSSISPSRGKAQRVLIWRTKCSRILNCFSVGQSVKKVTFRREIRKDKYDEMLKLIMEYFTLFFSKIKDES